MGQTTKPSAVASSDACHAMGFRRRRFFILAGFGFVLAGCWFFRPTPSYDPAKVDPRLTSLEKPYQQVRVAYYMDGGSIGIEIVDKRGRKEQFAIPAHLGDTNRYTRIFVGAMYDHKQEAVEIIKPEPTKRMLIEILAAMPDRSPWDDYCLMALRRSPTDVARCLIHKLTGSYRR